MITYHVKILVSRDFTIHHGGQLGEGDLTMSVIERHRSPLARQIHEGVELETNGADFILNSKSERNYSRIPRIVIEEGDEQTVDKIVG